MSENNQTNSSKSSSARKSPSFELKFGNLRVRMVETMTILVAFIGAIIAILTFYIGSSGIKFREQIDARVVDQIKTMVSQNRDDISSDMNEIRKQTVLLKAELSKLTALPEDTKIASQLTLLDKSVKAIDGRLLKLEKVILDNPAKALEMPLLRNELSNVRKVYEAEMFSLRQEIARFYDLNKWFIGLMFTMALGIVGLAITNFIRSGKSESS